MNFALQPLHIWVLAVSAWVNREQAQAIEYLIAENQMDVPRSASSQIMLYASRTMSISKSERLKSDKLLAGKLGENQFDATFNTTIQLYSIGSL